VAVGAVHLVPELFAGEGVFAEEEGAEVLRDYSGGVAFDGSIEAVDAGRGADAEVDGGGVDLFEAGRLVGVGGGALVFVDVERVDLGLGIDAAGSGVSAVELDDFYGLDFEDFRTWGEGCGEEAGLGGGEGGG
jgi:hypothetical protein